MSHFINRIKKAIKCERCCRVLTSERPEIITFTRKPMIEGAPSFACKIGENYTHYRIGNEWILDCKNASLPVAKWLEQQCKYGWKTTYNGYYQTYSSLAANFYDAIYQLQNN